MSDIDTNTPSFNSNTVDKLKARCKELGINAKNMGESALREKIMEAEAELKESENKPDPANMTQVELRQHLTKQALKLIRCRVFNNNPNKANLQGELFCVGNKYLGMVKKFVPFGEATEHGYHIPSIIFDNIKSRKYQQITTRKSRTNPGDVEIIRKQVPEYTLEILEPLTKEELAELALNQAAAERVGV